MKEILERILGALQEGRDLTEAELLEARQALAAEIPEERPEPGITRMGGQDEMAEFRSYLRGETRSLHTGVGSEGGYLVPQGFYRTIVEKKEKLSVIRKLATVQSTTNKETPVPIDASTAEAQVIAEGADYPLLDLAFGQKVLRAHKFGGITTATEEIIQDAAFNIEELVASRIAKFLARAEDKKFINGTGTGEPRGLLLDVTVVNNDSPLTPGTIPIDIVREMVGSLDAAYLENATWLMSQSVYAALLANAKQTGDYYLLDFVSGPAPKLAGRPVAISAYMPAANAQSSVVLVLGDFSEFLILDREGMELQVLKELYAWVGKIGYKFHTRTDGVVVVSEAFVGAVTGTTP
ncbi:MAG: phage major capsid protein [Firmicutes bacterium]|nr:phage major capsid protein [Bacillota bacterium]